MNTTKGVNSNMEFKNSSCKYKTKKENTQIIMHLRFHVDTRFRPNREKNHTKNLSNLYYELENKLIKQFTIFSFSKLILI